MSIGIASGTADAVWSERSRAGSTGESDEASALSAAPLAPARLAMIGGSVDSVIAPLRATFVAVRSACGPDATP